MMIEQFRQRKLNPGEALSLFLHNLKQLLDLAMPKLDAGAKEQLISAFLAGLPGTVSKQLKAAGNTTKLQTILIERSYKCRRRMSKRWQP